MIEGEVCKKSVSFKCILLSMGKRRILTCPTKDLPFLFSSENKNCCCCSRYYLRLKEGKSTQDEAAFLSQPALSGKLGRNRMGHTDLTPRDVGEDFLVIKLLRCFLSCKAHMEFCSDNLCPSNKNTVIFPKITISRLETSYVTKPAVELHRAHTSCLLEM